MAASRIKLHGKQDKQAEARMEDVLRGVLRAFACRPQHLANLAGEIFKKAPSLNSVNRS